MTTKYDFTELDEMVELYVTARKAMAGNRGYWTEQTAVTFAGGA